MKKWIDDPNYRPQVGDIGRTINGGIQWRRPTAWDKFKSAVYPVVGVLLFPVRLILEWWQWRNLKRFGK